MFEWFYPAVALLFGLIIGSFLNVVIYRFHTNRSLNDRSHCLSCGRTLAWYELFPVFSYLTLRGRCRSCSSFIPYRYALVESLTAGLFLLAYLNTPNLLLLALLFSFIAVLVVVLVYDFYHMIIPDELSAILVVLAVASVGYQSWLWGDWSHFAYSLLSGLAAFTFFASLWWFSGGRWLGFGDAKLAVGLGIMVGVLNVFSLVIWSFWIGAGLSILLLLAQKVMPNIVRRRLFGHVNMKSEIPFAPFLIFAFVLVYFFDANVFSIIENLYETLY